MSTNTLLLDPNSPPPRSSTTASQRLNRAPGKRAVSGTGRTPSPTASPPVRGRVSRRDLLFVTVQLSIMTRAGVDLATALESIARQSSRLVLANVLRTVHADVAGGMAVSEAFARHPHVFGHTYIATLAAGEASGRVGEVLSQLAELQRGEIRMQRTLRSLLAYPIVLASVCFLVLTAMVFFVLPTFAEMFESFDTPLPALTRALLAFSGELRSRWWLWLPLIAIAITAGVIYIRAPSGRRQLDRLVLRVRLVRDIARALLVGRAMRLLATMLDSGITLVEGLGLVSLSTGNSLVREALANVRDDVLKGRPMASSFLAADVVPPTAAEMIAMAERTGNLAMVSRLIGEYFEEEGETQLRSLVTLLEPAIVLVMGGLVALVVLSVMLPMFDLVTLAQKS